MELYENIKKYRKERGLTQDELAKKAGYTDRSSIAKIEKGIVDLSQSKIKQFADIFGISPGDLIGWDDDTSKKEKTDIAVDIVIRLGADKKFAECVEILNTLDDNQLSSVKQLLCSFIK